MSAAWLKNYLAPIRFLVNSIAQVRDDRVNFRNGFSASQVPDADGNNVLTIDASAANTSYEPTASTIPIRNGSGTLKGATITATSFTYSSPVTIQYDEPMDMNSAPFDTDWQLTFSRFPTAMNLGISWLCNIKPPDGSLLKTVSTVYTPPGGHVALPLTTDRTLLALVSYAEDGSSTSHGSVYDDPADIASYEVNRTLTLDLGAGITIDGNRAYVLVFRTEQGANAVTGTIIYRQARWTAQVSTPLWS